STILASPSTSRFIESILRVIPSFRLITSSNSSSFTLRVALNFFSSSRIWPKYLSCDATSARALALFLNSRSLDNSFSNLSTSIL
ncbi:hypothetical protein ACHAXS_002722, partial [Conticribra weissflogii]